MSAEILDIKERDTEGAGKVGAGEAVMGAGAALATERERLFREFVELRDTLVSRGA